MVGQALSGSIRGAVETADKTFGIPILPFTSRLGLSNVVQGAVGVTGKTCGEKDPAAGEPPVSPPKRPLVF